MKSSDLLKVVPAAAIALSVYSTGAVAGATNRDDNTAATPGPEATTTTTPADPASGRDDMRRGTTQTENMDTPTGADVSGSGSSGGAGSVDDGSSSQDSSNPGSTSDTAE